MRILPPAYRHIPSLSVLAAIGLAGLLTPWPWAQLLGPLLVVLIVAAVATRRALRRASRRIGVILDEELNPEEALMTGIDEAAQRRLAG